MLAIATPPAPPLEERVFPVINEAADRYQVVPCTVDPAAVRLILYQSGRVAFTRRLPSLTEARTFAQAFAYDDTFRKSAIAVTADAGAALRKLAAERDGLKQQLEAAEDRRLTDIARIQTLGREIVNQETSNQILRDALRMVRRDRGELQILVNQLQARLAALEEDDVVYLPIKPAPAPKLEVFTLNQSGIYGGGNDDKRLADKLNEGWEKWYVLGGRDGDNDLWRSIILTREIEDDAAGDDPDASAEIEPADEAQPLPAGVYDTQHTPKIDLDPPRTYVNQHDVDSVDSVGILSAMPLFVGALFVS